MPIGIPKTYGLASICRICVIALSSSYELKIIFKAVSEEIKLTSLKSKKLSIF